MFAWSDESRRWYGAAARASTYHADQARALAPWLSPSDTVAEFGCGLGCLALALAGQVAQVTAFDVDRACLVLAEQARRERGIANVELRCEDALNLPPVPAPGMPQAGCGAGADVSPAAGRPEQWDVVVCCLFGTLARDAATLVRHARRHVLALVNTGKSRALVPSERHRARATADDTARALAAQGLAFERRDLAFDFGQPFTDRDEARAFVGHYSQGALTGRALEDFLDANLATTRTGLFLPHTKHLSLFILPAGARTPTRTRP